MATREKCVSRAPYRTDYFCPLKKSVTEPRMHRIGNTGMPEGVSMLERRRCGAPGAALHARTSNLWFFLRSQLAQSKTAGSLTLPAPRAETRKLRLERTCYTEEIYCERNAFSSCTSLKNSFTETGIVDVISINAEILPAFMQTHVFKDSFIKRELSGDLVPPLRALLCRLSYGEKLQIRYLDRRTRVRKYGIVIIRLWNARLCFNGVSFSGF